MSLTRKQLDLLSRVVTHKELTVNDLSTTTNTPLPYTSSMLKELQNKGFIKTEKEGNSKTIQLADTQHASLLRKMILDQPHINLDVLTNKRPRILAAINCLNLRTWKEMQEAADTSYLTLQRHMALFREMGLIQKKQAYIISPRFQTLREFLEAYQEYTQRKEAQRHANDAIVKWGCGDQFLLETEEHLNLTATGITAFPQYRAPFITAKNLYLHTGKDRPLTLEDHLINHVLSEGVSNIMPLLITWRLNQDNIDKDELKAKAYKFRVDETINSVIDYLDTEGAVKAPFLPDWDEFTNKYREYSHD